MSVARTKDSSNDLLTSDAARPCHSVLIRLYPRSYRRDFDSKQLRGGSLFDGGTTIKRAILAVKLGANPGTESPTSTDVVHASAPLVPFALGGMGDELQSHL